MALRSIGMPVFGLIWHDVIDMAYAYQLDSALYVYESAWHCIIINMALYVMIGACAYLLRLGFWI